MNDNNTLIKYNVTGCDTLCIRKDMSTDSDIVAIVSKGVVLGGIKSSNDEWLKIKTVDDSEINGYCMAKFVKQIETTIRNEVKHG